MSASDSSLSEPRLDVAIVGAGAAGLATAIFLKELRPSVRVALFDGARKPGAKILVSGGSRCNVTNAVVTERDFNGGSAAAVRRVLRALSVADTRTFFERLGVRLHEEEHGKLFPDTNRSRDVLDALLGGIERAGVRLRSGERVTAVAPRFPGFRVTTTAESLSASTIVLATGGLSLPKTGSDGGGYAIARSLGHSIVATSPALVPLTLDATDTLHAALSGVAHDVTLDVRSAGRTVARTTGALLWTHFGISGPAVLDVSRHFLRLSEAPALSMSALPGERFETLERHWLALAAGQPRSSMQNALASLVPASFASAILQRLEIAPATVLADLTREHRRKLVHSLLAFTLPISGSRGYNYAEVTAGGVSLAEIDPATMESRVQRGLYLVGEILDVDGRIGGFNFQWAWSSARAAASALSRRPA